MENIMKKKYEITKDTVQSNGITLHRIKALHNFGDVKAGETGGWLASELNLDQVGNCWIYPNAAVYGNAKVLENAKVCDMSNVWDNGIISGNAILRGLTMVYDNAKIYDKAEICGCTMIFGVNNFHGG